MISKTKKITILTFVIATLVVLILGGGLIFLGCGNQREYIIVDVIVQSELDSEKTDEGYRYSTKYLYFCTTDKGEEIVFMNEDHLLFGKFNSSDILAKIKKYEENGKPFKVKTVGFRIGFLSTYQNIIKIEDINYEN